MAVALQALFKDKCSCLECGSLFVQVTPRIVNTQLDLTSLNDQHPMKSRSNEVLKNTIHTRSRKAQVSLG